MRGSRPTSTEIGRISSAERPSGRRLWTAMRWRMVVFSSRSKASWALLAVLRVGVGGRVARVLVEHLRLDRLRGVLAGELVLHGRRLVQRLPVGRLDLAEEPLVHDGRRDLELGLGDLAGQLALRRAQLLDLAVGDVERVEHLGLGDLVRPGLDHQDRLVRAGHDQVEVGRELLLLGRVDHEVAVHLADAHRADRRRERDAGDHQGRRRAVHGEDVVRAGRGRSTAGWRRAASRSASPWGRAAAGGGRSCARSGSRTRPRGPRA